MSLYSRHLNKGTGVTKSGHNFWANFCKKLATFTPNYLVTLRATNQPAYLGGLFSSYGEGSLIQKRISKIFVRCNSFKSHSINVLYFFGKFDISPQHQQQLSFSLSPRLVYISEVRRLQFECHTFKRQLGPEG